MRLAYIDGWLCVDFAPRGNNFEEVVECTADTFNRISNEIECREACSLSELIDILIEYAHEFRKDEDDVQGLC